jgi:hypothetical protein
VTVRRLVAVILIYLCVALAWAALGTSILVRTESGYDALGKQVKELWGAPHVQKAPEVRLSGSDAPPVAVELESSKIDVDLKLQHRRKGLLWYATYYVAFDAYYIFRNPLDEPATASVRFEFPSTSAIYDDFEFRVGDVNVTPQGDTGRGPRAAIQVGAGEAVETHITYKSRGLDSWLYSFADEITTVRDFALSVKTDFDDYNFPAHTISASTKRPTADGWELRWRFENLVSDFDVGVEMPHRLNPGPLASRMSYFAPVSLLFFFTVLVVLGAVKSSSLHPMHYFFLGASFFAFHILFAYLVDHVVQELSFVIAAAVSMVLVISYLWRVAGWRFAVREAGVSQLLFLVLFSYAFFLEGYTGLVVTIGAVVTLAVLMHVTVRVNWTEVFGKPPAGAKMS